MSVTSQGYRNNREFSNTWPKLVKSLNKKKGVAPLAFGALYTCYSQGKGQALITSAQCLAQVQQGKGRVIITEHYYKLQTKEIKIVTNSI